MQSVEPVLLLVGQVNPRMRSQSVVFRGSHLMFWGIILPSSGVRGIIDDHSLTRYSFPIRQSRFLVIVRSPKS